MFWASTSHNNKPHLRKKIKSPRFVFAFTFVIQKGENPKSWDFYFFFLLVIVSGRMVLIIEGKDFLRVSKPGGFKPGFVQFSHRGALLRSFAPSVPFCALLHTCVCSLLRVSFCIRPRLEWPLLGNSEEWQKGWMVAIFRSCSRL